MKYTVIIEGSRREGYSAFVPDLPGCTTEGESLAELRENVRDAVSLYIESLKARGYAVPEPKSRSMRLEVAA